MATPIGTKNVQHLDTEVPTPRYETKNKSSFVTVIRRLIKQDYLSLCQLALI